MSANNYLVIVPCVEGKFYVEEKGMEFNNWGRKVAPPEPDKVYDNVWDAIRGANAFMEENEVEGGLHVPNQCLPIPKPDDLPKSFEI